MTNPPPYFERVRTKAAELWDKLEGNPDLAGPWYQLFKQVQSPRHVLSELLQNADDAGATEASVYIEDGVFVFEHNGKDFTEEDFASLCRFGYSNKRVLHTIGFRGIGFKSAFSLGNRVELVTPSLAVQFERHRFSEPVWSTNKPRTDGRTRICVTIADDNREREIEKNLHEWQKSPLSLLFFNHIRHMRINDQDVRWIDLGLGPVPNSRWMKLQDGHEERVLMVHSEPESFPEDALAEIRDERTLSPDEPMEFPPYQLQIVLGVTGHLFVVLPTGVETFLPFACNAPFIQDPARLKIKDPETSPTNRWLLQRTGTLAASAMLAWIQDTNLPLVERAQAYNLMPDVNGTDDSLESTCSSIVTNAFAQVIQGQRFLLTDNDEVMPANESIAIPQQVYDIWPSSQIARLLDDKRRSILSRHVDPANCHKLLRWRVVDKIDQDWLLRSLQYNHLPKPASWKKLLQLWEYLAPRVNTYWVPPRIEPANLKIVPVHGSNVLHAANEVVRLSEKKLLSSEEDWQFLASYLVVFDQGWARFVARLGEKKSDEPSLTTANLVQKALAIIGLDQASNVSQVVDRVTTEFFARDELAIADCVRLTQIAAKLGATVGDGFRYYTSDGNVHPVSSEIIVDMDGTLVGLLPESIRASKLLHPDYTQSYAACSREEWSIWVSSGGSGLRALFPFVQSNQYVPMGQIEQELHKRGVHELPSSVAATEDYNIEDWDFHRDYWHHWQSLAEQDARVWARLVDLIIDRPVNYWREALGAKLLRYGSTRRTQYKLFSVSGAPDLLPSWALKFRNLPCLRDTRGVYHKPPELLRRTPQTEALIDVEPFVDHSLDREATQPLLDVLGVQSTPTGPERLIDNLKALSMAPNPPIYEVDKWYRRLDQMVANGTTSELHKTIQAFQSDKLILAADGSWVTSSEVFRFSDEDDVPNAAVIRAAVTDLTLWSKIGVAERPTADLAIDWLQGLPSAQTLPPAELSRVRALLARHPVRIWEACGHWLNLVGQWTPVSELSYGLSMQSLVLWSHLYAGIKQKTADLQHLPREVTDAPPFSTLPVLAHHIEDRLHGGMPISGHPEKKDWLTTVGNTLCRIVLDDEDEISRIRGLAEDLAKTGWQSTPGLEIRPYIDGTPAGTPRHADVAWLGQILYVDDIPRAKLARLVPEELGKRFSRPDIKTALDYSFERSPVDIQAYLEENFRLTPYEDMAAKDEQQPEPLVERSALADGAMSEQDLIKRVISEPGVALPSTSIATEEASSTSTGNESGASTTEGDDEPRYPDLDLEKALGVWFATDWEQRTHTTRKPKLGAGLGTYGSVPPQQVTQALGHQGERWAYAAERQRLATLGLNPDELEEEGRLVWVSEKNPTANHDIKSIWDKTRPDPVYIEVKSTIGDIPNIWMSLAEFQFAMSHGEHYWLYWVAGANKAKPELPVCYRNFAQLVVDEVVDIDVETLFTTLPKARRFPDDKDTDESR